jgi:branched-subunit amino acid transport protein AzlD
MTRILIAVIIMTAATQLTRAFPFLLFSKKKPPARLISSARLIPGAVMAVLVATSVPHSLDFTSPETWIPLAGVASVSILHLSLKHPLISVFGGTGIYMTLLHFFS